MVVSDAGPLIHLAQINQLHLIKSLFEKVLVTLRVKSEAFDRGVELGCDDAEIIGKALEEGWIAVDAVPERLLKAAERLAVGENISHADAETLLLAKHKKAELLVDDKVVADLAKMYGVRVWNTWTILLESLNEGLVQMHDIEDAINELGKKRHKLKEEQAAEILRTAETMATRKKTKK
jgi:predicted nucleic acid-binding protein